LKRYFKILGWIFLGVFLQFKFNALYGIVFLENLNFHDRTYYVKVNLVPADEAVHLLHVETIVHHSLGSDYFANVYIPDSYQVVNKEPYTGTEAMQGYRAYKMNMKRKYRDVLSIESFILVPSIPGKNIPSAPILIHFENMKQRLHDDGTYKLSIVGKNIRLEGPKMVEATYPQKLGM
tara:strand:+ start:634 stop:1167 length:534 start_codon:yes stop_codon:yes gene_type:complete